MCQPGVPTRCASQVRFLMKHSSSKLFVCFVEMKLLSRSGGRERFYKVASNVELQHTLLVRVPYHLVCLSDRLYVESSTTFNVCG